MSETRYDHAGRPIMDTDDPRLKTAREVFAPYREPGVQAHPAAQAALDLLDYAEERLRINVGLIAENATLKTRLRDKQPEPDETQPDPIEAFVAAARAVMAEVRGSSVTEAHSTDRHVTSAQPGECRVDIGDQWVVVKCERHVHLPPHTEGH